MNLRSLSPQATRPRPRPTAPPRPSVESTPQLSAPSGGGLAQGLLLGAAVLGVAGGLAAPARAAQVQVAPQEGTLYLSDFFRRNSPAGMPHGEMVERSARQLGFAGPIVRHEVPENALTHKAHRLDVYLDQRQFTPAEMRQFLSDYAIQCQAGQMQTATADLKMWLEEGAHHSAVNLSRGCGQAQVVEALYQRIAPAYTSYDPVAQVKGRQRLAKVAPAFEVKLEELISPQPAVSGPARLKLQQGLVDLVARSSRESSLLAQTQAEYDATVSALARQKVSVVVAAANSGQILEEMARDAGGARVTTPTEFWNNRLANAEVVTVGGTQIGPRGQQVAGYSNPDPAVDFFADGDAWVDPDHPEMLLNYGTSFATPRVGAVISRVHQQNPEWTNQEVHRWAVESLAASQCERGQQTQAPCLDSALAAGFLSSGS